MKNGFPEVVLCGSLRGGLRPILAAYDALCGHGALVLSPRLDRPIVGAEERALATDHFLLLAGREGTPTEIEARHVQCIDYADFVWLYAPDGYVGPSTAFEVGVAHAAGIPVYSLTAPESPALAGFVEVVESIGAACVRARTTENAPPRTLDALQAYFSKLATERGYQRETPIMAFLGCVEELGELAREFNIGLGGKPRLRRPPRKADELADLLLQVVHLANRDQHNLHAVITQKIAKYPPVGSDTP